MGEEKMDLGSITLAAGDAYPNKRQGHEVCILVRLSTYPAPQSLSPVGIFPLLVVSNADFPEHLAAQV